MKKIFIIFIMLFMYACTKEATIQQVLSNTQTEDYTSRSGDASVFDNRIQGKDGVLYFPDAESCINTMLLLSSHGSELQKQFESTFNFISIRSWIDVLKDDLEQCTTQDEYDDTWEYCKEYLYKEDDMVLPKISAVGYMSIANLDGIFYIGDIKHTITPDALIVEDTNALSRSESKQSIAYNASFYIPDETRSTTTVRCTDNRYVTSNYKIFSRTNLIRYITAEKLANGNTIYKAKFSVQVHTFGHKKKALIGWNDYKDRYYIEEFHFDVVIGNAQFSFRQYNDHFSHSEYCRDLYYTQACDPNPDGFFIVASPDIPMPENAFRCIVHRCRSRSIGKCGVLTDNNYCRQSPILPIAACLSE
ncbi:MAG: hypothetical protein ACI35M_06705 [Alistipes sp.]